MKPFLYTLCLLLCSNMAMSQDWETQAFYATKSDFFFIKLNESFKITHFLY